MCGYVGWVETKGVDVLVFSFFVVFLFLFFFFFIGCCSHCLWFISAFIFCCNLFSLLFCLFFLAFSPLIFYVSPLTLFVCLFALIFLLFPLILPSSHLPFPPFHSKRKKEKVKSTSASRLYVTLLYLRRVLLAARVPGDTRGGGGGVACSPESAVRPLVYLLILTLEYILKLRPGEPRRLISGTLEHERRREGEGRQGEGRSGV